MRSVPHLDDLVQLVAGFAPTVAHVAATAADRFSLAQHREYPFSAVSIPESAFDVSARLLLRMVAPVRRMRVLRHRQGNRLAMNVWPTMRVIPLAALLVVDDPQVPGKHI